MQQHKRYQGKTKTSEKETEIIGQSETPTTKNEKDRDDRRHEGADQLRTRQHGREWKKTRKTETKREMTSQNGTKRDNTRHRNETKLRKSRTTG